MIKNIDKNQERKRRHARVRKKVNGVRKVSGTATAPRISVYRSLNHIYVQLIDDVKGVTICSASTMEKDVKAEIKDMELLLETRIEVLRAANKLDDTVDMEAVRNYSRCYYQRALEDGSHVAILVFHEKEFVGAGGISFYEVMPTYDNTTGRKAYVMNMYTRPAYRRMGAAYQTMDLLVLEARQRGISFISLEASEMGRLLYEKYGFVKMEDEMLLRRRSGWESEIL